MMATGPVAQFSLALAMIAVLVLGYTGVRLVRQGGAERTRGWLMVIVAIVIFGNVLIWAWPAP